MSETIGTYRVKPGCTISHKGICYAQDSLVELTDEQAEIHAPNIENESVILVPEMDKTGQVFLQSLSDRLSFEPEFSDDDDDS